MGPGRARRRLLEWPCGASEAAEGDLQRTGKSQYKQRSKQSRGLTGEIASSTPRVLPKAEELGVEFAERSSWERLCCSETAAALELPLGDGFNRQKKEIGVHSGGGYSSGQPGGWCERFG